MNRLESTIEDVHAGLAIHCLPDEWDRTAKVLVAEVDRLRAELAACRAAREAATAEIADALNTLEERGIVPDGEEADDTLSARILMACDQEAWARQERDEALSAKKSAGPAPPAPAAIAMWTEGHGADGDVGIHVTLLADGSDEARATYESGPGGMRTYRVASWTWHPAGTPGPAGGLARRERSGE
jgi:hypothetical protein